MQVATFRAAGAGGGDTAPPTAAITAPAPGATVSGTVTLTATATDNVGVAGVQFLVDNNLAGRRGHRLALQRDVEHHDGGKRHPHADRASPATPPATPQPRRR